MLYLLYEKKYGTEKVEDVLERYVDKGYFIQFSDIEKLGINPRSKFDTPLGIYSYPLTMDIYQQWENGSLPFAVNRKYIILFKPKTSSGIIHLASNGEAENFDFDNLERFISNNWLMISKKIYSEPLNDILLPFETRLKYLLLQHGDDVFAYSRITQALYSNNSNFLSLFDIQNNLPKLKQWPKVYELAKSTFNNEALINNFLNRSRRQTSFNKFWYLTLRVAKNLIEWRRILVSNGINGVVDLGSGTVHPNEPTQAVFFIPNQLKLEKILDNKHVKSDDDEKLLFLKEIRDVFFSSDRFQKNAVLPNDLIYEAHNRLITAPQYDFNVKELKLKDHHIQEAVKIVKILKSWLPKDPLHLKYPTYLVSATISLIDFYTSAIKQNSKKSMTKPTKKNKKPYGHGVYPSQKLINMFDY